MLLSPKMTEIIFTKSLKWHHHYDTLRNKGIWYCWEHWVQCGGRTCSLPRHTIGCLFLFPFLDFTFSLFFLALTLLSAASSLLFSSVNVLHSVALVCYWKWCCNEHFGDCVSWCGFKQDQRCRTVWWTEGSGVRSVFHGDLLTLRLKVLFCLWSPKTYCFRSKFCPLFPHVLHSFGQLSTEAQRPKVPVDLHKNIPSNVI